MTTTAVRHRAHRRRRLQDASGAGGAHDDDADGDEDLLLQKLLLQLLPLQHPLVMPLPPLAVIPSTLHSTSAGSHPTIGVVGALVRSPMRA